MIEIPFCIKSLCVRQRPEDEDLKKNVFGLKNILLIHKYEGFPYLAQRWDMNWQLDAPEYRLGRRRVSHCLQASPVALHIQ